ncbi:MAG: hypothetical protein A2Z73_01595 [Deltaproteobacteria bacterium RBG_13_60_28]|nr:MAG: hypothetical protein A2Z73_01595 [Deltaproteobacteria bacterium RBG_13_60_28]
MIQQVRHQGQILAIIIRDKFRREGIEFFTPPDFSKQLAYMCHPAGKIIQPHIHNPVACQVRYAQEVLFIKRGKLRADLYDEGQNYVQSLILEAGDVILLASGGHGFEVLEELEMIEVKQGPFTGEADKVVFNGITSKKNPQE